MTEELEVTASMSKDMAATATLESATLASDGAPTNHSTARHQSLAAWQGMVIGRYIAISQLGAGAMGIVLAAYDPQLDRKVALKLLVPRGDNPIAARARLQREAQALAKLDNPNVVGVHDVGVHGDQLFVAMDFVAGKTLGAWMEEVSRPRPYQEVLSVFADAGRGLAAAHRAGLIHRDFKPDNVMLGDDGRVRVMDFGLARVEFDVEANEEPSHEQPQLTHLTRAGSIMGTPAYMPLEQFEARETDARSDQFSFCVSLYQALYGERPFAGRTYPELLYAVSTEQVRPAPRDSNVPVWLRKVVLRGLAKDPAQRWPSMSALLDAMADDPTVRRRRWSAAAGLVVLLGGGAWGIAAAVQQDARVCQNAEAKLDGTWDAARRVSLRQAILGSKLSYAPETLLRVEQHLDDYAAAWVTARTQACEATHSGEQSSELMDLRMACLDERLLSLRKTVDELSNADATTVSNAVEMVLSLPSLDGCADVDALRAEVPPPEQPEVAARVQALDERLLDSKVKSEAGHYDDARAIADEVVAEAEQIDYEPLRARAWLWQGKVQRSLGEFALAEATFEKAFAAAVAKRMTTESMTASLNLAGILGPELSRHEDGRYWIEYAEPLSRAVGTDAARAEYFTTLGNLSNAEGKFEEARQSLEHALAIREQAPEQDPWDLASTLRGLGVAAAEQGRVEDARAYFERALTILENMLGSQHPAVAAAIGNLASAECMLGNWSAGRELNERALDIEEKALGPEHPDLAVTLHNLGNVAYMEARFEDARVAYERALTIEEKHFGKHHPKVGSTLLELGDLAVRLKSYEEANGYLERALDAYEASESVNPEIGVVYGTIARLAQSQRDFARARTYHQRALELHERVLGPDHPDVGQDYAGLADVAYAEADYEAARTNNERALAILEGALGPDHLEVAYQRCRLAATLVDLGDTTTAISETERALLVTDESVPGVINACRFTLARALWDAPVGQGRDRERARELALLARPYYAESGEIVVEDWLRDHGG